MFELIKGDWENLEGRVVSYSKLSDKTLVKNFGVSLFPMYASADIMDFAEKMGFSEEGRGVIQRINELKEKSIAELNKNGIKINFMPIYAAPLPFEDEKEIIVGNHDVIFAGEWGRIENCVDSIEIGVKIYSMKHAEQVMKKHGLGDRKPRTAKSESYSAYSGKSLKNTLLNDYVTPILDARNNKDSERVNLLGLRMAHFIEGASFAVDGLELMALAKSASNNRDYLLIECYLNKIDAIHLEKYEDAAKYRDAIMVAKK
jgi:hypothetical protein